MLKEFVLISFMKPDVCKTLNNVVNVTQKSSWVTQTQFQRFWWYQVRLFFILFPFPDNRVYVITKQMLKADLILFQCIEKALLKQYTPF